MSKEKLIKIFLFHYRIFIIKVRVFFSFFKLLIKLLFDMYVCGSKEERKRKQHMGSFSYCGLDYICWKDNKTEWIEFSYKNDDINEGISIVYIFNSKI